MHYNNISSVDDLIKRAMREGPTREDLINRIIDHLKHMDYDALEHIAGEMFDDAFNISDKPMDIYDMDKEELVHEAKKLNAMKDQASGQMYDYQKERFKEIYRKLEDIAEEELMDERGDEELVLTHDITGRVDTWIYE